MTAAFPAQTKGKMNMQLLSRISSLCGGGCAVVEAAELASGLPRETLKAQLLSLAAEGVISLSYAEDGVFCLALTEKGKEALSAPAGEQRKRGAGRAALLALAAFLGGFLGAMAAALLGGAA